MKIYRTCCAASLLWRGGLAALVVGFILLAPLAAKENPAGASNEEEFFIVSSVDPGKKQILLKRPTEVTELALVTEKTVFLDEEGKPLRFADLRAGDTIYLRSSRPAAGAARAATRIRKGPMTVKELQRRYLKGQ